MIAMALINDPDLIIFDEPTTALDVTPIEVMRLIRKIVTARGRGAVCISHDLAVVAQLADRLMALRHGKVVETGATHDLMVWPAKDYTPALVAARTTTSPPMQAENAAPIIALRGFAAGYNGVSTVRDINLDLSAGHITCLVGESGSTMPLSFSS